MYNAQVELLQLARLDFFIEDAQSGGIFRSDDDTGGIAVNPVTQRRCEAVFLRRIINAAVVKMVLYTIDERIAALMLVLMNNQTGGLIDKQDIFIFINNIDCGWRAQEGEGAVAAVKKRIVEIERELIAGAKTRRNFTAFSIEFNTFGTDRFIQHGLREQRNRFCQKLIDTLSSVVTIDLKFPHNILQAGFHFGPVLPYCHKNMTELAV